MRASSVVNNSQIAHEMQVDLNTVRLWRTRWLDLQNIALDDLSIEELLEDLPPPGAPAGITADQICQMACEKPEDRNHPISQWTPVRSQMKSSTGGS
jgi:hypothetical protein